MSQASKVVMDGNEAAAYIAYRVNEVMAIYPITPSSPMGELCDEWASHDVKNIWNSVPHIQQMQSEGGCAGAVHGALQAGSLTTTFTASQGLLLMVPNMFKIAGELTPMVLHVAARSIAAQALSIFGDHSDVMAARSTGFAMLCSSSIQEVMDFALIAQAATLESRIPFIHFFDGFRTSHEVTKIDLISDESIRQMIDDEFVLAHRQRGLTPDKPVIRGTTQNPDVYFQARETVNPFYNACPMIVQKAMDQFARLTGRAYQLYQYEGDPEAERVVVIMGSGSETCQQTVAALRQSGQKVGVLKIRLYRPFVSSLFMAALPKSVRSIAVLDRTKEPGSSGEPLYLDVVNAVMEADWSQSQMPKVVGGRYGLSSKEFTPGMVSAIFDNLAEAKPKNHFTIGINDDVSHTSLTYADLNLDQNGVRAVFFGLGSDGTVGANKNSIKIIGENTDNYVQGYFVYDSKKSGSMTVSHLRFGPEPIHSPYLISQASFLGCHQFEFIQKYDILKILSENGVLLLNSPHPQDDVWDLIPREAQQSIIDKKIKVFVIDAYAVAKANGMGARINTIMQTCFFAISGVLPRDEAIVSIKKFIQKSYGKKGEHIVAMNNQAVDQALAHLDELQHPQEVTSTYHIISSIPNDAPDFVKNITAKIMARDGDEISVSELPADGTYPTATTAWEKRNIAQEIPEWDKDICIQCGKCVMVCPHAVIRFKAFDAEKVDAAPEGFKTSPARDVVWKGLSYSLQVAPEDCTGCGVCVDVCPVKNKKEPRLRAINMVDQKPILEQEKINWKYFLSLPETDRRDVKRSAVRSSQVLKPLFEFSGACSGCGETPYVKLVSQLFGDRMLVANATGCSSIYGGNLPTTPWCQDENGRGPAWSNSLFEDNAEFGLGMRLALDQKIFYAQELLKSMNSDLGDDLVTHLLTADQSSEAGIFEQRERITAAKNILASKNNGFAKHLLSLIDVLARKSVWIIGGDGWAYDIGYGGLDHVLASGKNVNVLVLDTEVYSNTGGQMSKATPRAAVAKFAAAGNPASKKNLARMIMTYENVYVAQVAMGAKDEQTLKAFIEAEAYDGPSLIIAYSHCIAHGINMTTGLQEQKSAVSSGYWPLFRYHPDRVKDGDNPLKMDSPSPKMKFRDYAYRQNRFKMLTRTHPEEAERLMRLAQQDVDKQWSIYQYLANEQRSIKGENA